VDVSIREREVQKDEQQFAVNNQYVPERHDECANLCINRYRF
jgi:hypothetical protein